MMRIKCFSYAAALILLLSGCSGPFLFGAALNDWRYDALPGDYAVLRVNSQQIILCKQSEGGTLGDEVVGSYISEIAFNDDYIFVQQTPVSEDESVPPETPAPNFYIVKVADDSLLGPYSEDEFQTQYDALGLPSDLVWTKSKDLPKDRGTDHSS